MKTRAPVIGLLAVLACTEQPLAPPPSDAELEPALAKGFETRGRILFTVANGETDIWAINPDGSNAVNLTPGPWGGRAPNWSPRARLIVFSDDRFGSFDIFVMREDGTGVTRLTSDPGDETGPVWSPDGRRIAFSSDADGDSEIIVMQADGTGAAQVTHNAFADFDPAWSPDGSRIAFITFPQGWDDLAVMNADGSNLQPLTQVFALNRFEPDWSPKGDRIAYFECGGLCGIKLVNPDGTNPVLFDPTPVGDGSPSWSPDGRQIVFRSSYGGGGCDLFRMNADGTSLTQVTFNGASGVICNGAPDWYR